MSVVRLLRCFFLVCAAACADDFRLEQIDLASIQTLAPPMGFPAQAARSVAGAPMRIAGKSFEHGLGLHSGSIVRIDLGAQAQNFRAVVGVDDAAMPMPKALPNSDLPNGLKNHPGTATVEIWLDGKPAFNTGNMRRGQAAKPIDLDLHGVRRMTIIVTDPGRWPYNN